MREHKRRLGWFMAILSRPRLSLTTALMGGFGLVITTAISAGLVVVLGAGFHSMRVLVAEKATLIVSVVMRDLDEYSLRPKRKPVI